MESIPSLLDAKAYQALIQHYETDLKQTHLRDLLQDAQRNAGLIFKEKDMVLDLTHSRLTPTTLTLLKELAQELKISEKVERMFAGEVINETEARPVLHVALRASKEKKLTIKGGENVVPLVH